MAKLSARGNHKVAQASRTTRTQSDDGDVRVVIALRSDDKVLRKINLRYDNSTRGWQQGSYSVMGALPEKNGKSPLVRFQNYAAERGYTLD